MNTSKQPPRVPNIHIDVRKKLAKSEYSRLEDIAYIKPNNYEDVSKVTPLAQAPVDKAFLAEVTCNEQRILGSGRRQTLVVTASDASATLTIRFHNFNSSICKLLAPGTTVRVYGTLHQAGTAIIPKLEMVHPRLLPADKPLQDHLSPLYPSIGRLPSHHIKRAVAVAVDFVANNYPELPEQLRRDSNTLPRHESLRLLHIPKRSELLAKDEVLERSLKHDEWLAHMILQQHQKLQLKRRVAVALSNSEADIDTFAQQLPFTLTNDQRQAMHEIGRDLAQPVAMRRLIHGDVGCGKTLVAAYACYLAAKHNHLAAIMCPTVILASQHFATLTPIFAKFGIHCVLLHGSTRKKELQQAQNLIDQNPNTVVIGTHTLFQDNVKLPDLSLAIIDEQHRFGVAQRKALERKGGGAHVLMLSATPIPRTLELGIFSHIDVTRILERPNKGEIKTLLFSSERADEVLERIIAQDLQAYWICPLIKKSEHLNLLAAEDAFARIQRLAPQLNPKLLHGKQANNAKLEAMRSFQAGTTRLLVATTVVEVGVDAPEADVVVIDNCERLGLSQLHQLRGRVGRGRKTGFCALLYSKNLSAKAQTRLQAMRASSDGFEIARSDLELRGPGDIVGKRQSGLRKYRFASLVENDPAIIETARKQAEWLLKHEPQIAEEHYRLWLGATKHKSVPPTKKKARNKD